ncbi:MAG: hypothetical protein FJW20_17280 [Acidimicrobiia bacterium]|nr:hypothetical protein [Acidimicrobiia bacterium]
MGRARILLLIALVASWVVMGWLYLELRKVQEAQQMKVQLLEKESEPSEVPRPAEPQPAQPAPEPREVSQPGAPAAGDEAARRELIKMLDAKQQQLDSTKAALTELQTKLAEMEGRLTTVSAEGQQLAAAEKDLRERLESSSRLADALQAEMKSRNDRLTQLQVANRDLLKRVEDTSRRLTRLASAGQEMEDINRRREVYMTGILRRYRELTDFYRNLALRVNTAEAATTLANVDLDRMQSAITLADEDMRQLRVLNAQAARLEKELAGARAQ